MCSTSTLLYSQMRKLTESFRFKDIDALGGAGFASQSTKFTDERLNLSRDRYEGMRIRLRVPVVPQESGFEEDGDENEKRSEKKVRLPTKYVLVLKTIEAPTRPDGRRESVVGYEFEFDGVKVASQSEESETSMKGGMSSHAEEEKTLIDVEEGEVDSNMREVEVDARWDEFKATYRGRPKEDAEPLDPSRIYEYVTFSLSLLRAHVEEDPLPAANSILPSLSTRS